MISIAEDRLARWGEWLMNGRGLGGKSAAALWGAAATSGLRGAIVPIKDLEASRTHDWFMSLPKASQMLLVEVYCTGRTSREHAARLQVSLRTLYTRLHKLHAEYADASRGFRPVKQNR